MRFSALVAFVLPFAALSVPVQCQAELKTFSDTLASGALAAGNAINATLSLAQLIANPRQQAVIDEAKKAEQLLEIANRGAEAMSGAFVDGKTPDDKIQVVTIASVFAVQNIINHLEEKINCGICSVQNLTDPAHDLRSLISFSSLFNSIAIDASLNIIKAQNKTVSQLFGTFKLPVPAGF